MGKVHEKKQQKKKKEMKIISCFCKVGFRLVCCGLYRVEKKNINKTKLSKINENLIIRFFLFHSHFSVMLHNPGEMIIPNDRYSMTETDNSMYAVQMVLIIKKLQKSDFGGYKCISKNSIGGIEATIRLYGECV